MPRESSGDPDHGQREEAEEGSVERIPVAEGDGARRRHRRPQQGTRATLRGSPATNERHDRGGQDNVPGDRQRDGAVRDCSESVDDRGWAGHSFSDSSLPGNARAVPQTPIAIRHQAAQGWKPARMSRRTWTAQVQELHLIPPVITWLTPQGDRNDCSNAPFVPSRARSSSPASSSRCSSGGGGYCWPSS